MPRGTLICIEGLDRTGKSTQATLLAAYLRSTQKTPIHHLRFPDRSTPIGQQINSYLTYASQLPDQAIHLLFSANRWEHAAGIRQAIERGETVVLDRYCYSGVVYSAAKGVEGLGVEWCWRPEVGLPEPDVVVFMKAGEGVAEAREGFGGERYEVRGLQGRVGQLFGTVLEGVKGVRVVEAEGSLEEVEERVRGVAEGVMRDVEREGRPLGTVGLR
ncbi:hypothetical protein MBLNU230_g4816t1 [Neophaeotheca triangularis]